MFVGVTSITVVLSLTIIHSNKKKKILSLPRDLVNLWIPNLSFVNHKKIFPRKKNNVSSFPTQRSVLFVSHDSL
jgi:hypothetical protein